jgi:uncharacterized protein YcbX
VKGAFVRKSEKGEKGDSPLFRPYLDLHAPSLLEEDCVGRSLRLGPKVVIRVLERDSRCVLITLDPDTGVAEPRILKQVAQTHQGQAGVYGAVLAEGVIHRGDTVELLD